MKYRTLVLAAFLGFAFVACGDDESDENNANNVNNSNNLNNSNNTNNLNNLNNTNNLNNSNNSNNTNNAGSDYIVADVDGDTVRADSMEGGVEPMMDRIQLRKTTADNAGGGSIFIYRISIPNTDVASYDCANDDVTVTYSQLDGQLINNWVADETCTIDVTRGGSNPGDVIVGTFTATATDGNTTLELTNGEFSLTR